MSLSLYIRGKYSRYGTASFEALSVDAMFERKKVGYKWPRYITLNLQYDIKQSIKRPNQFISCQRWAHILKVLKKLSIPGRNGQKLPESQ